MIDRYGGGSSEVHCWRCTYEPLEGGTSLKARRVEEVMSVTQTG